MLFAWHMPWNKFYMSPPEMDHSHTIRVWIGKVDQPLLFYNKFMKFLNMAKLSNLNYDWMWMIHLWSPPFPSRQSWNSSFHHWYIYLIAGGTCPHRIILTRKVTRHTCLTTCNRKCQFDIFTCTLLCPGKHFQCWL